MLSDINVNIQTKNPTTNELSRMRSDKFIMSHAMAAMATGNEYVTRHAFHFVMFCYLMHKTRSHSRLLALEPFCFVNFF